MGFHFVLLKHRKNRQILFGLGASIATWVVWCILDHSSIVYRSPILVLQRAQIAIRFGNAVSPPLDSGILWPHWKSKTVILFVHQLTLHFPSNTCPISRIQSCSRTAFGIFCLRFFDLSSTAVVVGGIDLKMVRTVEWFCAGAGASVSAGTCILSKLS